MLNCDQGSQRKPKLDYEAEFMESEKKLKFIFDNVGAGIIVVSSEGTITFPNRRMAEMLRISPSELSSQTNPQITSSSPWQSSGTILLVEDSEQLRTMTN